MLLAHRIEDRRVLEGVLGCMACGGRYPVRGGFVDLAGGAAEDVHPDRAAVDSPPPADPARDDPPGWRTAALLGVSEGPGYLLLVGALACEAGEVASLAPGVEVLAVSSDAGHWPEAAGVSRLAAGVRLPLANRSVRGAALAADAAGLLEEAARVLRTGARLVLSGVADARRRVGALGLRVLAEEGDALVAVREGGPDPPRLYQLS